jgi:hypothetical protein
MTIRNVYLHELEGDCAAKDQNAYERETARICRTKEKPENRVCAEALNYCEKCLKESAPYKLGSRVERR